MSLSGTAASATGTITDDDTAPTKVALSVLPASVAENASEAVEVTVTGALEGGVALKADTAVTVSVGSGTAVSGTDFAEVTDFTLTIAAGSNTGTATFDLDPTDDAVAEGSETVAVTGTTPEGSGLTVDGASVSITDDDAVTVSVAAASAAEGAAVEFTVSLSGTAASAVTVAWKTADGTATGGTDYTAVTAGSATVTAGQTSTTVSVSTTEDVLVEGDETFTVTLSVPSGQTLPAGVSLSGTAASATGTITDDDTAPTKVALSVLPASVAENASEAVEVTVTGALEGGVALKADTAVTVSVGSGTAVSGTDFAEVTDFTLTIAAGSNTGTATFDLDPTDDAVAEGSETVAVTGSTAHLTVTGASVTIADDDTATVSVAAASAAEGAAVELTVSLSGAASSAVTVAWKTADGTAEAASDYTAVTAGSATVTAGATSTTIQVSTIQDVLVEGDETFTVTLSVPSGGTLPAGVSLSGTAASATGTITDDDTAPAKVALSVSPCVGGGERVGGGRGDGDRGSGGRGGAQVRYGGDGLGRQRHGGVGHRLRRGDGLHADHCGGLEHRHRDLRSRSDRRYDGRGRRDRGSDGDGKRPDRRSGQPDHHGR